MAVCSLCHNDLSMVFAQATFACGQTFCLECLISPTNLSNHFVLSISLENKSYLWTCHKTCDKCKHDPPQKLKIMIAEPYTETSKSFVDNILHTRFLLQCAQVMQEEKEQKVKVMQEEIEQKVKIMQEEKEQEVTRARILIEREKEQYFQELRKIAAARVARVIVQANRFVRGIHKQDHGQISKSWQKLVDDLKGILRDKRP